MIPGSGMYLDLTLGPPPVDEPASGPIADEQLTPHQKAARTLAAHRSAAADWRRRKLQEDAEERDRSIREQLESGRLVLRQATEAELQQIRRDRERLRESMSPEERQHSLAVAAALRRLAGLPPDPEQPKPKLFAAGACEPRCARDGCDQPASWGRWCSRRCSALVTAPPLTSVDLPPKACKQCGETFQPRTSRTLYCGKTCSNKASAARQREAA